MSARAAVTPVGILPHAEKIAWLRLSRTENIGPVTFYQMMAACGTASAALDALPEIAARSQRKKPFIIPPVATAEREYEALTRAGGTLIAACEDAYPLALSALEDAPPLLSVLGNPRFLNAPCVAIVGSRNASLNGRRFAEALARDLGRADHVVVSGLARGIDTAAHIGALETGTIAVVAGGIDVVYPPENQKLYDEIRERGAIIAESPFGQQPFAQSFPRRNRIVSGLSAGVVVVEASQKSGSLITARNAGEQGRDVYAVPGHPLDPRAAGPNHLIREGATLVRDAADILESLRDFSGGMRDGAWQRYTQQSETVDFGNVTILDNGQARAMLADNIGFTPVPVDDLIRACAIPAGQVQGTLLDMELSGEILRLPGNRVVRLGEKTPV
jgi:DNA processing protein